MGHEVLNSSVMNAPKLRMTNGPLKSIQSSSSFWLAQGDHSHQMGTSFVLLGQRWKSSCVFLHQIFERWILGRVPHPSPLPYTHILVTIFGPSRGRRKLPRVCCKWACQRLLNTSESLLRSSRILQVPRVTSNDAGENFFVPSGWADAWRANDTQGWTILHLEHECVIPHVHFGNRMKCWKVLRFLVCSFSPNLLRVNMMYFY